MFRKGVSSKLFYESVFSQSETEVSMSQSTDNFVALVFVHKLNKYNF